MRLGSSWSFPLGTLARAQTLTRQGDGGYETSTHASMVSRPLADTTLPVAGNDADVATAPTADPFESSPSDPKAGEGDVFGTDTEGLSTSSTSSSSSSPPGGGSSFWRARFGEGEGGSSGGSPPAGGAGGGEMSASAQSASAGPAGVGSTSSPSPTGSTGSSPGSSPMSSSDMGSTGTGGETSSSGTGQGGSTGTTSSPSPMGSTSSSPTSSSTSSPPSGGSEGSGSPPSGSTSGSSDSTGSLGSTMSTSSTPSASPSMSGYAAPAMAGVLKRPPSQISPLGGSMIGGPGGSGEGLVGLSPGLFRLPANSAAGSPPHVANRRMGAADLETPIGPPTEGLSDSVGNNGNRSSGLPPVMREEPSSAGPLAWWHNARINANVTARGDHSPQKDPTSLELP